jgi:hypothetical protein
MEDQLRHIINCAVDRVNDLLPTGDELAKDDGTVLLGRGAVLDSMGFVNFAAALEEELEQQLGIQFCLADEIALRSQSDCTIGSLYGLLSARGQRGGQTAL